MVLERATCDAEWLGNVDGPRARAVQDVTPAVRKLVLVGGSHDPGNLIALCSGHHAAHHEPLTSRIACEFARTQAAREDRVAGMRRLVMVIALVGCSKRPHRVDAIAAGPMNACALSGGRVTCWGEATAGMMGTDDVMPGSRLPRELANITDATAISVGLSSACAIRRDRTLVCWGIDWANATAGSSRALAAPTAIAGIADVVQVSAGESHVCAVTGDGRVSCWGNNFHAQCGAPRSSAVVSRPTAVPGITDAVEVAAGTTFTCVRHREGGVSCFGTFAPLEDGRETAWPVDITGAAQLAAGDGFACARKADGSAWCWGDSKVAQLAPDETATHAVRLQLDRVVSVATSSSWDACALTGAGELWCWGVIHPMVPGSKDDRLTKVAGFPKASAIAVGDMFACAIAGGEVWCAGDADHGETGHGHAADDQAPVRVGL